MLAWLVNILVDMGLNESLATGITVLVDTGIAGLASWVLSFIPWAKMTVFVNEKGFWLGRIMTLGIPVWIGKWKFGNLEIGKKIWEAFEDGFIRILLLPVYFLLSVIRGLQSDDKIKQEIRIIIESEEKLEKSRSK
jgi:hypothetical protein